MGKKIKSILIALALVFVPFVSAESVYAAEGRFEILSVEVSDKSSDVIISTPTIAGTIIASDVTFHRLDDYVTYSIVLKNAGVYDRKIVDITDDNANTLFSYTYNNHADETVKAGENLNLDVTVTYASANDDNENRDIASAVSFGISYLEIVPEPEEPEQPVEPGTTEPEQPGQATEPNEQTETIEIVPAAPNTGVFGDTTISANKDVFVVSLVVMCAGLIAATVLVMKGKGNAASKVAIASLMVIAISPLVVRAEDTDSADLEIVSNISLRDKVKLSFRTMLGDESKWEAERYYDYGAEPFANTEDSYYSGYRYMGAFNRSDNSRYDFAPLSDDVDIAFVYELEEYDIVYNLNGGALKTGDTNPSTYTIKSDITLKNPVREGFTFNGWFDVDGNKITTIKDKTGYLELEARWTEIRIVPFFELTTMQEMSTQTCTGATTPKNTTTEYDTTGAHNGDRNYIPTVTVTDVRDNNRYQIAKLADGKCWMLDELRLIDIELNSDTSDLAEGQTYTVPASSRTGFNTNKLDSAYLEPTYGGHYTWKVATAGEGTVRGSMEHSICPKNWKLPEGRNSDSDTDYSTLYYTAYGGRNNYDVFAAAAKMRTTGYLLNSNHYAAGQSGYWWTNRSEGSSTAVYASLYPSRSDFAGGGDTNRQNGSSVRCIAR